MSPETMQLIERAVTLGMAVMIIGLVLFYVERGRHQCRRCHAFAITPIDRLPLEDREALIHAFSDPEHRLDPDELRACTGCAAVWYRDMVRSSHAAYCPGCGVGMIFFGEDGPVDGERCERCGDAYGWLAIADTRFEIYECATQHPG